MMEIQVFSVVLSLLRTRPMYGPPMRLTPKANSQPTVCAVSGLLKNGARSIAWEMRVLPLRTDKKTQG